MVLACHNSDGFRCGKADLESCFGRVDLMLDIVRTALIHFSGLRE